MNADKLDSSKSLYIQIKDMIKQKIISGEYKPGKKIPSENELCELYNVSRITIRNAFSEAIKEGLLYTIPGKGTFVKEEKDLKISQKLVQIDTFENTIKSKGLKAGSSVLSNNILKATTELSGLLSLKENDSVLQLNILGTANDHPFVLYESFFHESVGKVMLNSAISKEKNREAFSTLDLYDDLPFLQPAYVEQTFEAIPADTEKSSILKVKKAFPLVLVISILYSKDNVPIEYKKAYYRSDKYKFSIKRSLI